MNHNNPATGLVAFVSGSFITITEFLRSGSVLLTLIGAGFSVLGGYWMYRAARNKAKMSEVELERARIELQQAKDRADDSHP